MELDLSNHILFIWNDYMQINKNIYTPLNQTDIL